MYRAGVATAHRDNDVGPLGIGTVELVRNPVAEVDIELSHHLDHLGMNVRDGGGASRTRHMSPGARTVEERL